MFTNVYVLTPLNNYARLQAW